MNKKIVGSLVVLLITCVFVTGFGKKSKKPEDLIRVAAMGGGLIIDAENFAADDMIKFAAVCKGSGARLTIRHATSIADDNLFKIAAVGSGIVVFDFE